MKELYYVQGHPTKGELLVKELAKHHEIPLRETHTAATDPNRIYYLINKSGNLILCSQVVNGAIHDLLRTYGEEIVLKTPRAENSQYYYTINSDMQINTACEQGREIDDARYESGNYFMDRTLAEKALYRFNQTLYDIHRNTG